MKESTAQQFANAARVIAPLNYVVLSKFHASSDLSPSEPMSYRLAKASAKAIRESGAWANVVRIISDSKFMAAIGPCGK